MIKVLHKVAPILRLVAERDGKATLLDISRRLKINKATLSHIMQTLWQLDYIERDAAKCYAIGSAIVALAESRRACGVLQKVAAVHARALAEELHESVSVSIMRDGDRYLMAGAAAGGSVEVREEPEFRATPYGTATGHLLLAYLSRQDLALVLQKHGWPGMAWDGITTHKQLQTRLADIRAQGLAYWHSADGQAEYVATPIAGPDGKVQATLGLGIPTYRFKPSRRRKIVPMLQAAGKRMATDLALWMGKLSDSKESSLIK